MYFACLSATLFSIQRFAYLFLHFHMQSYIIYTSSLRNRKIL